MSCKLSEPGDTPDAQPLVWQQVGQPTGQAAGQPAGQTQSINAPAQIAELERRAEQRAREAYANGVREGEKAGRAKASAEMEPVMERMARSIEDMAGVRDRLRREAEADLLKLALEIARRVLRRELAVDPEALHGLVLAAFEKLQLQEVSRVRVHPAHVPLLSAMLHDAAGRQVEVIADPGSQLGGLIFESTHGNLDASVDSQLREIERGLTDCLRRRS